MPREFVTINSSIGTITSSIGRAIKEWHEVDDQPLPEHLCKLLARLDETERSSAGQKEARRLW